MAGGREAFLDWPVAGPFLKCRLSQSRPGTTATWEDVSEAIPGRGNSKYQGSEAGSSLAQAFLIS